MNRAETYWKQGTLFTFTTVAACLGLCCMTGCKLRPQTDQQVTQQAAQATKQIKAEAQQAAAQAKAAAADAEHKVNDITAGVREGLYGKSPSDSVNSKTVNVNYASEARLTTLPGITPACARRIVNNRPYNTPQDLVSKGVLTRAQLARISGRVVTWDN